MTGALALLAGAPARAAPASSEQEISTETLTKTDNDSLFEAAFGSSPGKAIATLDRLIKQTDNSAQLAILQALRGAALVGTNDIAAAIKAFDASNSLNAEDRFGDRNDRAGAEKITLEMLNDPDQADTLIVLLQRKPFDRDDPSLWVTSWQSLRGNPAIDAAFNRIGSDLPDLYHVE